MIPGRQPNIYDLRKRLLWLVNLRWGGIVGVLITTHVVRELNAMSFSLIPVYLILGAATCCNLVYRWRLRLAGENLERLAHIQIVVDQLLLALSVYFSGGCDSPFIYFFMFHVVISGIMLPWRNAFIIAGIAILLPAVVLGLKHLGILPHYGIFKNEPMIFTDNTVITSYALAFISTVFLTAYFVTYLSRELYEKNEEVLKLYSMSERLRSSIRFKDVVQIIERELVQFVGARSSVFLPLDRESRTLTLRVGSEDLRIPLIDKNSFTDSVLRGVAMIIDRRYVLSNYEIRALDLMKTERGMILPVMAAALQPCHEYFQCKDENCAAFGNQKGQCWQVSGTHCKGAVYGNYLDKLFACLTCDLFTPVGAYFLELPKDKLSLSNSDLEAPMRLLEAASLAVSNALLHEKTIQLSKTDGLTGLRNHREFKDAFHAELLRAKRYQRPFSLLLIDVDHFKHYNDTNGHPQGDVLLRKISELLQDNFKDTDIVARYGGEEFAVLLVETGSRDQAVAVAERLKGMVDWCKFPHEESQPGGKITVSIGVSCFPEDGQTVEDILQAADKALYRAKKEGRNRVVAAG